MFEKYAESGKKCIMGLVHLRPMPNTPFYQDGDVERSLEKALKDVRSLINGGADGCLIQSVDRIYPLTDDTDYARVATLAMVTTRVRDLANQMGKEDFVIGCQLMTNCITPSMAVAKCTGADWIRCTALVGSTNSAAGTIVADTLKVMNYRKAIAAENIDMVCEVASKHFKYGNDLTEVKNLTSAIMRSGGNSIEVSNPDEAVNEELIKAVKSVKGYGNIPVILGGDTNIENCQRRLKYADGALVGSCFQGGKWGEYIVEEIVAEYCKKIREIER